MNHTATSKETILDISLKYAADDHFRSLNMRDIARACGVSVGCIYSYFPSKADLVSAAVEKIWEKIFNISGNNPPSADFREYIRQLFRGIKYGCEEYPSFFISHSANFTNQEKDQGRRVMNQCFQRIQAGMRESLNSDSKIRKNAFDENFSQEDFISFIFANLNLLGTNQADSCDYLIELITRLIY